MEGFIPQQEIEFETKKIDLIQLTHDNNIQQNIIIKNKKDFDIVKTQSLLKSIMEYRDNNAEKSELQFNAITNVLVDYINHTNKKCDAGQCPTEEYLNAQPKIYNIYSCKKLI